MNFDCNSLSPLGRGEGVKNSVKLRLNAGHNWLDGFGADHNSKR